MDHLLSSGVFKVFSRALSYLIRFTLRSPFYVSRPKKAILLSAVTLFRPRKATWRIFWNTKVRFGKLSFARLLMRSSLLILSFSKMQTIGKSIQYYNLLEMWRILGSRSRLPSPRVSSLSNRWTECQAKVPSTSLIDATRSVFPHFIGFWNYTGSSFFI